MAVRLILLYTTLSALFLMLYVLTSYMCVAVVAAVFAGWYTCGMKFLRFKLIRTLPLLRSEKLVPHIDWIVATYDAYKGYFVSQNEHIEGTGHFGHASFDSKSVSNLSTLADSPHIEARLYVQNLMKTFYFSWYDYISTDIQTTEDVEEHLGLLAERLVNEASKIDSKALTVSAVKVVRSHVWHHYHPEGAMVHPALTSCDQQHRYLGAVCRLLQRRLLPADIVTCPAVHLLITDLLTQNLLSPLMQQLATPAFIYSAIVLICSDEEPDVTTPSDPVSQEEVGGSCEPSENSTPRQTKGTDSLIDGDHRALNQCLPSENCGAMNDPMCQWSGDSAVNRPITRRTQSCVNLNFCPEETSGCFRKRGSSDSSKPYDHSPVFLPNTDEHRPASVTSSDGITSPLPTTPLFSLVLDDDTSDASSEVSESPSSVGEVTSSTDDVVTYERAERPERLVAAVCIPSTETVREFGGLKAGLYAVYLINYNAWHPAAEGEPACWQPRSGTARRRYREFVTMHERLSEHPTLKSHLRGIKGPTKWSGSLFGSTTDARSLQKRIRSLEHYLQTLIRIPELCNSSALLEFLAYDGDPSIAYVRKPSSLPRIHEVIFKTANKVVNKVTSTLPKLPEKMKRASSSGNIAAQDTLSPDGSSDWIDTDDLHVDYSYTDNPEHFTDTDIESVLATCVRRWEQSYSTMQRDYLGDDSLEIAGVAPSCEVAGLRQEGDGCEQDSVAANDDVICSALPLSVELLDLALFSLRQQVTWVNRGATVRLLKLTLGRAIETVLERELDHVTSGQQCARYLQKLRDTFWPGGEFCVAGRPELSADQLAVLRKQAHRCLRAFLPGVLNVCGEDNINTVLEDLFDSIENLDYNRSTVYHLLDTCVLHYLQTC